MRTLALDADAELVGSSHGRAGAHGDLAQRQTRHVVKSVDGFTGEAVEQVFLDHHPAAGTAFLGRLEE